jgi:molybdopterin converting factor small subunit
MHLGWIAWIERSVGGTDVGVRVHVRYLSALRDWAGRRDDLLALEEGATLADLAAWLRDERGLLLPDAGVMATLNGRGWGQLEQGLATALADGDEVSLFPVISGG